MRQEIKELIEYVEQHQDRAIKEVVVEYFKLIIWSLEKDEFENRMNDNERAMFVKAIEREMKNGNEN